MTRRRHLRPWAWTAIHITAGTAFALIFCALWCYVIEAMTGFNPLWLVGAL